MPRVTNRLLTRAALCTLATLLPLRAEVNRVVILKIDGVPPRLLKQRPLPNIERIFGENGVRVENFYVRGLSLSAPSWSLLDTGRHLEIRGNVEYDRYTLRPYDYLNFVPFYFSAATSGRVDMRGVEMLDEIGIPLLLDRFAPGERYQAVQLLQRGVQWDTLKAALKRLVAKAPREALDEWIIGPSIGSSIYKQYEYALTQALKDPGIRYLDFFTGEYDHVAHLTNDPVSQAHELQGLDEFVGRVWSAIQQSPLAATTALVLVSDHGMNTSADVMSQGFNLVDWFNSKAGGGHHVLTNRHPLQEFKMRGLDPFVSAVVTPSAQSPYLGGQGNEYPTVMLDLDGNERASIGLRNNTLNTLHIFLDQLTRRSLAPKTRAAAIDAFMETLDRVRKEWSSDIADLNADLAQLDVRIAEEKKKLFPQSKKKKKRWTKEQIANGTKAADVRAVRQLDLMIEDRRDYAAYTATIARLLALTPADFDPGKPKLSEFVPTRSLGPLNSAWDLQNYVTGPGPQGFVLTPEGTFDWERSFARVNYLESLRGLAVKNNVQEKVSSQPVDFIAVQTSAGVWLYHDEEHQALIESRGAQLRYRPIAHLKGAADGSVQIEDRPSGPGFPLKYSEDPFFTMPRDWLMEWHTEREWLDAVHRTRYSNAIIGLAAQLRVDSDTGHYQQRKRQLRRTDLLVVANDHWNFNVRGFNPGGNHGSFLRDSTHSVLMFAGGGATGIFHGKQIEEPYDSLSFVPTILELLGRPEENLPGPAIEGLLPQTPASSGVQ